MRETIWRQPDDLRRLVADPGPAEAAAERLAGRRLVAVGTGTSWHAANHAVWLLREAGVDATALQAMDAALYGVPAATEAVLVFSHRNTKRFSSEAIERLRAHGAELPVLVIGGIGSPGVDVETVEQERSAAFTASHLGALLRAAQIANALGARLALEGVPDAVEAALDRRLEVEPPPRLLELIGAGPNQWTAAEGALKARETSRVATEGLSAEQFFHGPSVALDERDALVALDGCGPGAERLAAIADAAAACGARVHRLAETSLGEPLSIFPLTVCVQRIALELAEALGADPDAFGYDVPGRKEAWTALTL